MKLEFLGSATYTHGIGLEYRNPANDGGYPVDPVWQRSSRERVLSDASLLSNLLAEVRAEAAVALLGLPEAANVMYAGFEAHSAESLRQHTQSLPPQTDRDLEWRLSKLVGAPVSLES